MLATTRLAASQVRRRHQITVIRATGARQDRSSADSRVCAGSGQPLPSPWVALLRVPVIAPGQTVRVCRIGSPTCLCSAARNAAIHPFPSWLRCAQGVIFPGRAAPPADQIVFFVRVVSRPHQIQVMATASSRVNPAAAPVVHEEHRQE